MRSRLTIFLALLATVVLMSSAFAKGPAIDPAAKSAPTTQNQITNRVPAGNLDEILASNDFEGAFPGTGWTQTITNTAYTWGLSSNAYEGSGAANCEYDPDLTPVQNEWLISPVIDMSEAGSYEVAFVWMSSYYWGVTPYDNYDIEVRISTDGGTTWLPNVLWVEDDFGVFTNWEWYPTTVDLSDYAGNANVKIGFRYAGSDGAQAELDNIVISSIQPGGTLAGTVTNSATSAPISGVSVTVVGAGNTGTTIANGTYSIANVAPGTYTVEFSNPAYEDGSSTGVVIVLGETTTLNMALTPLPIVANNSCSDPFEVPEAGEYLFSTVAATVDGPTTDSCQAATWGADIWMSYLTPSSGTLTVSTCNTADYDTRIACYSNGTTTAPVCPLSDANFDICNDDGADCGLTSEFTFAASANVNYLIRVGGYTTGNVGTGTIAITLAAAPTPAIATSTDDIDFGIVEVGVPTTRTFTVSNTGTAPLSVTSITCPTGYTAAPGAFALGVGSTPRTVTVTLTAPDAGTFEGNLSITSNAPTTPTLVHVTGGTLAANENPGLAESYYVATSYPNPFNPETTISFAIPKAEYVVVTVYNSIGQAVSVLNNGRLDAGHHDFTFNAADLPSGLYFARITSDGFTQTLKTVLMK